MSTTMLRRVGAAALGVSLLAAAVAPAQAHDEADKTAKAIGAGWLNSRLGDGLLHAAYDGGSGPVDYADYGGTVEAAYALDAVGRTRVIPKIADALEGTVDAYITGGSDSELYAGPTGKLLAFVSDLGGDADPTAFGGTDLVQRMEDLTTESGRIADVSGFGDYANVFGQIWATRGLLNVDSPEASAALDYLLSQQCADGHFPTYFDSCSPAGPDGTAFAVILLHDYAAGDADLAAALDKGTDWLVDWQGRNGGLADDNGVVNADSTGLGGWAFGIEGRAKAAQKAAIWLRALQVAGRPCDQRLARQRGAIAYDKAAFKAGRNHGITQLTAGQWQTVEAQALPALAAAPAADYPFGVASPARLPAGGRTSVQVQGLAPGERACVGIGRHLKAVTGRKDDLPFNVRIDVPSRKGPVTVKLQAANRVTTDSAVVR